LHIGISREEQQVNEFLSQVVKMFIFFKKKLLEYDRSILWCRWNMPIVATK